MLRRKKVEKVFDMRFISNILVPIKLSSIFFQEKKTHTYIYPLLNCPQVRGHIILPWEINTLNTTWKWK